MIEPKKEQSKCQQRDILVTSAASGLVSDSIIKHLPQGYIFPQHSLQNKKKIYNSKNKNINLLACIVSISD